MLICAALAAECNPISSFHKTCSSKRNGFKQIVAVYFNRVHSQFCILASEPIQMYFWRDAIFVVEFRHARHRSAPPHYHRTCRRCSRLLEITATMHRRQNIANRQRQTEDARHLVKQWQQREARASAQRSASCQLTMRLLAHLALRERWQQRPQQRTTLASIASVLPTRATSPAKVFDSWV